MGNAALVVLTLALAFGACELAVRALYKDSTVLFPRYHTDYRYGRYLLRGNRPDAEFWHTSVDGKWKFVTNDKGFRDTRDFPYEKAVGTIRVLVLGDSHTQGHEVRQEATYSAVLERYLKQHGVQAEVLNAGVSGFSTAEELAFLENEGYKYEPDFVVLGFFANDFEDNLKADLFEIKDTQLIEAKHKHIPGVRIQNAIYRIPGVRWLSENSYFYSLIFNTVWHHFKSRLARQSKMRHAPASQPTPEAEDEFEFAVPKRNSHTPYQVELAARLIDRMQKFCTNHGIGLIIVDIPTVGAGSSRFGASVPSSMTATFDAMQLEHVQSSTVFSDFAGAVEIHVPHGYRHISEFAHALIGVELGRRILPKIHGTEPAHHEAG